MENTKRKLQQISEEFSQSMKHLNQKKFLLLKHIQDTIDREKLKKIAEKINISE